MFQSARSKREGEAHTTNEEPRGLGQAGAAGVAGIRSVQDESDVDEVVK